MAPKMADARKRSGRKATSRMQRLRVISWAYTVLRDWRGTQKALENAILALVPNRRRSIEDSRIFKRAKSRGIEPNYSISGFTMPALVNGVATISGLSDTPHLYWHPLWEVLTNPSKSLREVQSEIDRFLQVIGLVRCGYERAVRWLQSQADFNEAMEHVAWRRQVYLAWQCGRLKLIPDLIRDPYDRLYLVALLFREAVLCREREIAESVRKDWTPIVENAAYVFNVRVGCQLDATAARDFVAGFFEENIPPEHGWESKRLDACRGVLMLRSEYADNCSSRRRHKDDMPWPLRAEYDFEVPLRLPVFLSDRHYYLGVSHGSNVTHDHE